MQEDFTIMKYPVKVVNNQWATRMSDTLLATKPRLDDHWNYDYGVCYCGLEEAYNLYKQERYFAYIKNNVDIFVQPDGSNTGYFPEEYNLDFVNNGKALIALHKHYGEEKYKTAADTLFAQLKTQPRNAAGGFWHKGIYPHQMWLDSAYMGAAFMARYAGVYAMPELFDDIALQITLMFDNMQDGKTGLLYHAWDAEKVQPWCDENTGLSAHFWGRAIGWYLAAICDILEYMPAQHPKRPVLCGILHQELNAVLKVQDEKTSVWYQILNQGDRPGNYLESSCSCLFVYAMLKGNRLGVLDNSYKTAACKAYAGIIEQFVEINKKGFTNINKVCWGAGLGGENLRDGDYAYYISEPILTNVEKGIGAFVLVSTEYERAFCL